MTILKAALNTSLRRRTDEPVTYQIHDCFEDYFPAPIEQHVRELNQAYPFTGLKAQIMADNLTEGQWLLYTTACFSGQVLNGGIEQFFSNCPGLIRDAESVLADWASVEFLTAYKTAAAPLLDVIKRHAELPPVDQEHELADFWTAIEAAEELIDDVAAAEINTSAYSGDRNENPQNWFTKLETKVLKFVEDNPEQFMRSNIENR